MQRAILTAALLSLALSCGVATAAQAPSPDEAFARIRGLSFQLRAGRYDVAAEEVTLARQVVAAWPNDARSWASLGSALGQQASSLSRLGPTADPRPALAALEESMNAFAKAVELDPTDAKSLSSLGANQGIMGQIRATPALVDQGKANMARASVIAPNDPVVRLRVFTNINMPTAVRSAAVEEEDLTFLVRYAGASRRGDHLRLLLGDFYAEAGKPDLARPQYQGALREGSTVEPMARARLASLGGTGVPAADIAALRGRLASDCAMCHGG